MVMRFEGGKLGNSMCREKKKGPLLFAESLFMQLYKNDYKEELHEIIKDELNGARIVPHLVKVKNNSSQSPFWIPCTGYKLQKNITRRFIFESRSPGSCVPFGSKVRNATPMHRSRCWCSPVRSPAGHAPGRLLKHWFRQGWNTPYSSCRAG